MKIDAGIGKKVLNPNVIFAFILVTGLLIRLLLLQVRWINPDEGAHLLDARLLLEGHVPVADFGARQPLYISLLALFLKVFGVSFVGGRLLPLISSVGIVSLLYLFGKRWFNATVGWISALIYAMLPLIVIWSTIVKTEQPAIFFGVLSMLILLEGLDKKGILVFLAGAFAACAFYIRQPTLYLPMAAVFFLFVSRHKVLKNFFFYLLGYFSVVTIIFLLYMPHMRLPDMLFSQLNPLHLIWNRLMHLLCWLPEQYRIVDNSGFRVLDQDMTYTLNSWYHALVFSLFIVFGALAAIVTKKIDKHQSRYRARILLFCWTGFVLFLYIFQTANRGFYTQYFTEALPPLILLASSSIMHVGKVRMPKSLVPLFAVVAFYVIYLTQRFFWNVTPGMSGYVVLSLGMAFTLYFYTVHPRPFGRMLTWIFPPLIVVSLSAILLKKLGVNDLSRFILVLLALYASLWAVNLFEREKIKRVVLFLFFGFFCTAFFSGHLIGPKYEAIWSQKSVEKVSHYLSTNGQVSDEVLSGGSIWTFESGLAPYLNVPHPTEFYKYHDANFELTFTKNPPRYIILDGYTKRKFVRHWQFITDQIEMLYEKVMQDEDSKYPVKVYQLIPQIQPESGYITAAGEN
ncbi:phospholipid carrier-dependent glycosyltransferase [candidate division KSB1 bacterium]|nr:glycosyltransferase family 39 protein [candidate division KSB1 bacterium]RQW06294.1 MAG: phospholipid carrier-dependent glycosyltransferase [candidate division KSB1 bacterium]